MTKLNKTINTILILAVLIGLYTTMALGNIEHKVSNGDDSLKGIIKRVEIPEDNVICYMVQHTNGYALSCLKNN